ncbi:pyridoxamine 5'-phosphate oxidase family protein [uncultured Ruegeria sp.]|uniref:pyridoxamine 5'-phosphate oxidase family protein n=1 Tax=uncultured Ruegeria sp. TaxID=259304 RepID=UPI002612721F|nr:pyridoxamine 5'-phosphate oxidase family protein [uncultured Ruegeria sp.]
MTNKHFHAGELRLQNHAGMRAKIDVMTQHLMRDFIPDQHREFFEELEYIFLGTVDQRGLAHASIVTGSVGFASSPDPKTLIVRTGPRQDIREFDALDIGQPVGVLGLDLSNRRRNRMHGRISAIDEMSININVVQSYGNCPKYINLREIAERNQSSGRIGITHTAMLAPVDADLIINADTFFIASYLRDGSNAPYEGVDVNHRGGQAGFISVDTASQITIPDYKGNDLYNTFGNLLLNPKAALLFVDFETGDQLHIHGSASLIEDADKVSRFPGAQKLLRVEITGVTRKTASTALIWRFIEASPVSPELRPRPQGD